MNWETPLGLGSCDKRLSEYPSLATSEDVRLAP
jgi:hypothetical protein